MTRPFKVLGIQQIAIGGLDKQRLGRLWIDMLGLQLTGNFRSERENVDEDITAMGSGRPETLHSIFWNRLADSAWLVGDSGLLLHYKPTTSAK